MALLATLVLSVALAGGPSEPIFPGLGAHRRPVTTRSALAQRYFDQGLNFLYGFNHDEAIRSFQEATRQDPSCAMAYWGIAVANGPHINNPMVDDAHAKAAWDAAKKALNLSSRGTKAERQLIQAVQSRYAMPNPPDRMPLDRAYADAMRAVWKANPTDGDFGALFAESMMDLRPWDLWKPNGQPQPGTPEIQATLERVIKGHPLHPLALHLYIHTMEASPNPGAARAASDRLRGLQPGLGHNVHMPSHIDVRIGRWKDAVDANVRAIHTDDAYRAKALPPDFYRVYMAHNHHMLTFAAMMRGQSKVAIDSIDTMVRQIPEAWLKAYAPFVDGYVAMPYEVRKRFGKWDSILAMPEPPEWLPLSRTMAHAARAVAFAAKGNLDQAAMEQALFAEARTKIPAGVVFGNNTSDAIVNLDEHVMNGEVFIAQGNAPAAIGELRQAIAAEDALRYDEPPGWIVPARHALGAYLTKLGRHAEAERVYIEDLRRWPENGWSLFGLAQSLRAQGKPGADAVEARFRAVWKDADMTISSSCLCVPGK